MQLKDIVKPIDQMTDEELLEHLRQIRHRRSVERPAARAKVERAEKKESRGKLSKMDKMLAALSPEDRAKLIAELGGSGDGEGS